MSMVGRPDWQAVTRSFAGGIIQPSTITTVPANSSVTFSFPATSLYEVNEVQASLPVFCVVELQPRDVNGIAVVGLNVGGINAVDEVELAAHALGGPMDVILRNASAAPLNITWALRGYLGVNAMDLRPPFRLMEYFATLAPGAVSPVLAVPAVSTFDEVAWSFGCTVAGALDVQEYTYNAGTFYTDTGRAVYMAAPGFKTGVWQVAGRGFGFLASNPHPTLSTDIHLHARARRFS